MDINHPAIMGKIERDRAEMDARTPAVGYLALVGLVDVFEDDTPLECGIENPETCESCQ